MLFGKFRLIILSTSMYRFYIILNLFHLKKGHFYRQALAWTCIIIPDISVLHLIFVVFYVKFFTFLSFAVYPITSLLLLNYVLIILHAGDDEFHECSF